MHHFSGILYAWYLRIGMKYCLNIVTTEVFYMIY